MSERRAVLTHSRIYAASRHRDRKINKMDTVEHVGYCGLPGLLTMLCCLLVDSVAPPLVECTSGTAGTYWP